MVRVLSDSIYDFLNKFIDQKLLKELSTAERNYAKNAPVKITGVDFSFDCWPDKVGDDDIICVQISRVKAFGRSEVYSLGVMASGNNTKKLTQEEMWDLGF